MDLAAAITQVRRRDRSAAPSWETAVAQGPASGGWVAVNATGTVEQAVCPSYLAPLAGDVLVIGRAGTPIVIGILQAGDPDNPRTGPAAPSDPASTGVSYFPALFAWTWEQTSPETVGRFQYMPMLCQGTEWAAPLPTRRGWWFYAASSDDGFASAPGAHLAGAVVDSARFRLPAKQSGGAAAVTLAVSQSSFSRWPPMAGSTGQWGSYPAEPPVSSTIDAGTPSGPTWVDLGATVGQQIVDATPNPWVPPVAIGVTGTGNATFPGLDADPQSGLLEITWHR